MKTAFFLLLALFLAPSTGAGRNVPQQCDPKVAVATWSNCIGEFIPVIGHKYRGEFQNGKYHGFGIYTYADGRPAREGIWENDAFIHAEKIPDAFAGRAVHVESIARARQKCRDLGLKPGTEKFGECVLRLSK